MNRISLSVILLLGTTTVLAGDEETKIRGLVLDEKGQPAPQVQIAHIWTPNDRFDENGQLRDRSNPAELKKFWTNTGRMRPVTEAATTDERGQFVLAVPDVSRIGGLLAFDGSQKSCGRIVLDGENEKSELVLQLQPLVRVHGKLRVAKTEAAPPWGVVNVAVPTEERNKPLASGRVAVCGTWDGEVSFRLPPGQYELDANTESDESLSPETLQIEVTADQRDYDLGTLYLHPEVGTWTEIKEAQRRGEWGDVTKWLGQPLPPWHVVAARGIAPTTQPADLQGKWTLVYFFHFGCPNCLATGLPGLARFYEQNRDKQSQFEIVGFCVDCSGDLSSMERLEQKLQPLVKHVWKGKDLPFPLLLDNTFTTRKLYGICGSPTVLLLDPEGKLVPGGLKELAEKIGAVQP